MQWRASSDECENPATGEDRVFVNVTPECYSGEVMHELHPGCWCDPEIGGDILIHRAVQ